MRQAPPRRLYRSRRHRVLAGVAGGIAEYLDINPTVVRLIWVLAGLVMGPATASIALVLYAVLAIILPPAEE